MYGKPENWTLTLLLLRLFLNCRMLAIQNHIVERGYDSLSDLNIIKQRLYKI